MTVARVDHWWPQRPPPVLPAISSFPLSETQKILLNIQSFSIYTGTVGHRHQRSLVPMHGTTPSHCVCTPTPRSNTPLAHLLSCPAAPHTHTLCSLRNTHSLAWVVCRKRQGAILSQLALSASQPECQTTASWAPISCTHSQSPRICKKTKIY